MNTGKPLDVKRFGQAMRLGLSLREGYVREGDRYVFRGEQSAPAPSPAQPAAAVAAAGAEHAPARPPAEARAGEGETVAGSGDGFVRTTPLAEAASQDVVIRAKANKGLGARMDAAEAAARKRLGKRGGQVAMGVDPGRVADLTVIGANYIRKGVTAFADWSGRMLREFGEGVRGLLGRLWDAANNYLRRAAGMKTRLPDPRHEARRVVAAGAEAGGAAGGAPPSRPTSPITGLRAQPGPGQEERRFVGRAVRDTGAPRPVRAGLAESPERFYDVVPNEPTMQAARAEVARDAAGAEAAVVSDAPLGPEKAGLAIALLEKYRAEGNTDAEVRLNTEYAKQLTRAGQFIQLAKLWSQMTGKAHFTLFKQLAKKYGAKLTPDQLGRVEEEFRAAAGLPEGAGREQAIREASMRAGRLLPLRFGDWLDAIRYSNMLSNPQTSERNSVFNMFNAYVLRPLSLVAQGDVRGALQYEQAAARAMGDAWFAFKQAMKDVQPDSRWAERSAASIIEAGRMENLPGFLTWVGRFLDAQDRFASTIIATGEIARLTKRGVGLQEAESRAAELARLYLLRRSIGQDMKNEDAAAGVRALDSLGSVIEKGRNLPVLGRPWGWFIPFVRTPIGWGKIGIMASPLGFIPAKLQSPAARWKAMTPEERGLATLGSAVTLVGVVLAASGMTTWRPPKDPDEKEAFYASGRKPYSVLIGGKWWPMWYFGPLAFALAMPAAARDAWQDNPDVANESWARKLMNVNMGLAQFFTSQTPLHNVSGFLRILGGEEEYTTEKLLAFTGGQFIPASGFVRYVTNIVDPTFRKARNFEESFKRDLPGLSKTLEPYRDPMGEPVRRTALDILPPFPVGDANPAYERVYQDRKAALMDRTRNNRDLDDAVRRFQRGDITRFDVLVELRSKPHGEMMRLRRRLQARFPSAAEEIWPTKAAARRRARQREFAREQAQNL